MNNNRSKQLNPNNDAFWKSRGYSQRPGEWDSSLNRASNDSTTEGSGVSVLTAVLGGMAAFGAGWLYKTYSESKDEEKPQRNQSKD